VSRTWIEIESCAAARRDVFKGTWQDVPLKRVRVLVANRPRLMRDLLLSAIADQPDIEVIGEVFEESRLSEVVDELQPDALIVTLESPEKHSALCGFLLGRHPKMKILALAPERNQGLYYWAVVDIRSQHLESSEAMVLEALRAHPPLVNDVVS
jgi:chemotaxis response regulator CheB